MKNLRPILPEILMIALMVAVSLLYMSPVFEGKTLPQGDVIHTQDQMDEAKSFQEETGVYPGWTNSAFSGMPTYQLISPPSMNIYHWMLRILKLYLPGYTAAILFLSFLGFYILLRTLKLKHWLALAGALAFGLSSHHLQLIITGHVSKIYSIAFIAPVIAGMLLVFKRKYLAGGLLTTVALGIQIATNHVQMSYYLGIMIILYMLVELVYALKDKYFDHFLKSSGILLAALILAILPNMTMLLTTYEYAQETTRGNNSQLVDEGQEEKSGLDLTYMTSWSYGKGETLNLFIPNLYGGGSEDLGKDSESYKAFQKRGVQNAAAIVEHSRSYWGGQPFTAGPHYVGAITIFLAIMGLLLIRGPKKWWLIIVIALSIMLSWGSNMMWLTEFFAKNVPLYAKFRDMTNNLIIAQFAIPLLAFLGIRAWIMDEKRDEKDKLKKLYIGTGIAGGIALIFAVMPGLFLSFNGPNDPQLATQGWDLAALASDREMLARKDAFRTLILVLLAAGVLYATIKTKIKASYLYIALAAFVLIDMWGIDKRYLSNDDFVSKRQLENITNPSPVDQYILQDSSVSYRVLDLQSILQRVGDPFRSSTASRYHKSIGGYHAAKLARYQNVIEQHLFPEINDLTGSFGPEATQMGVLAALGRMKVHHMLNTKYIVFSAQQAPLVNTNAMGPVWFVDKVQLVESDAEEISRIREVELQQVAVVHKSFSDDVSMLTEIQASPTVDEINMVQCDPNYLKYTATNNQARMAVFSEVWYPHGWKAFVDGQEQEIIRVNYVLRGLIIPAGNNHTIEFKFEPSSLKVGQTIALISSILILLIILGYAYSQRTNCPIRLALLGRGKQD
jgi:hypothetical protein